MAGLVAELVTELTVNAKEFKKGLQEAQHDAQGFSKAAAVGFVAVAAAATATITVFGILGNAILEQTEKIDQMAKAAARLGIGQQAFQQLSFAAMMSDTSITTVQGAMVKLQKSLIDVDEEGNQAGNTLKKLGVDAQDFQRLSLDQQVIKLSDAFKKLPEGSSQIQAALSLFGRSGTDVLNLLQSNVKGSIDEFNHLHLALSAIDIKNIEKLDDAVKLASASSKGFKDHLAADLASPFADLITNMTQGFGDVKIAAGNTSIFILSGIKTLIEGFNIWKNLITDVIDSVVSLGEKWAGIDFSAGLSKAKGVLDEMVNRLALVGRAISNMSLEPSIIGTKDDDNGGLAGLLSSGSSFIKSIYKSGDNATTANLDKAIASIQNQMDGLKSSTKSASEGMAKAGDDAQKFGSKLTNSVDAFLKAQGQGGINRILTQGPNGLGQVKQVQDDRFDKLIREIVSDKSLSQEGQQRLLNRAKDVASEYGNIDRNYQTTTEMTQTLKDVQKYLTENYKSFQSQFSSLGGGAESPAGSKINANTFWDGKSVSGGLQAGAANSFGDGSAQKLQEILVNINNGIQNASNKAEQNKDKKVDVEVHASNDFIVKVAQSDAIGQAVATRLQDAAASAAA